MPSSASQHALVPTDTGHSFYFVIIVSLLNCVDKTKSHTSCSFCSTVVYHHHMAPQPKSGPGLPCWGFVTITFLQGWIVSPAPNPQPGGPGLRIYDPWRQGDPAIPQDWVPILVAFYDMHGLQCDYSLIPATTQKLLCISNTIKKLHVSLLNCDLFVCSRAHDTHSSSLDSETHCNGLPVC
jgi:hypothetical protein